MSDLEDLADIVDEDAPRRDGHPGRVHSGLRLHRAAVARYREANTNPNRLRLSSHTPSLPKIKFLEGSDE